MMNSILKFTPLTPISSSHLINLILEKGRSRGSYYQQTTIIGTQPQQIKPEYQQIKSDYPIPAHRRPNRTRRQAQTKHQSADPIRHPAG